MLAGAGVCASPHPCRRLSLLVQPVLTPQAAEAADVCQREGEAKKILVAHVGDRIAAILQSHAAAIPVVRTLRAHKLQSFALRVETETAGCTEAALIALAISQGGTKLVEAFRLRRA